MEFPVLSDQWNTDETLSKYFHKGILLFKQLFNLLSMKIISKIDFASVGFDTGMKNCYNFVL